MLNHFRFMTFNRSASNTFTTEGTLATSITSLDLLVAITLTMKNSSERQKNETSLQFNKGIVSPLSTTSETVIKQLLVSGTSFAFLITLNFKHNNLFYIASDRKQKFGTVRSRV